MISTENPTLLPDSESLKMICKAIAVLDAIIYQEEYDRYYMYWSEWSTNEECFQMYNGSGDELHILFCKKGCVINGFAHEFKQQNKKDLTQNLPDTFKEFIFSELIEETGTTFCLWNDEFHNWHTGKIENYNDNSKEMLKILDGNPKTYIDWANEYYRDYYKGNGIPLQSVMEIYNGKVLTKEIVHSIVRKIEDWDQLKYELDEINYPYDF